MTRAPVALTVAKLGAIPGIVCSLDDEGALSACYQGTDPPTSTVVAADTKEVDYDQINQEHRKLLQVKFSGRGGGAAEALKSSRERAVLECTTATPLCTHGAKIP